MASEQLRDEADRGDDESHDAGERAEAERLHEQDRDDDRMERAAERDEAARRPADPDRRQVACGQKPDGERQQDAEEGRDDGDLDTFDDSAGDQLPSAEIRREHASQEAVAMLEARRKPLGAEAEL